MGYGAYVPCNCVKDGRTTPPPAGIKLTIVAVEWAWDQECWETYDEWSKTACPHAAFEVAREWLSNAGGFGDFRETVRDAGRHPTLIAHLPTANGGCIPAEEVAKALEELDDFRVSTADVARLCVLDSDTGAVLAESSPHRSPLIVLGGGDRLGFDERGFFVHRDPGYQQSAPPAVQRIKPGVFFIPNAPPGAESVKSVEAFRAMRVEQRPV